MVNTLVPDADRTVGRVNTVTGRGRHTSSSVLALPLPPLHNKRGDKPADGPGDGWLIDTPGLRGFGLGHVSPERVVEAFGDLAEGAALCPAGCDHLKAGCALDQWAREHHAVDRLDSLRRLLASREDPSAD
jgi:ribosome biogenesis GTPase